MKIIELTEAKIKLDKAWTANATDYDLVPHFGLQSKKNADMLEKAMKASGFTKAKNEDSLKKSEDEVYMRDFAVGFHGFMFKTQADLKKAAKLVKEIEGFDYEGEDGEWGKAPKKSPTQQYKDAKMR